MKPTELMIGDLVLVADGNQMNIRKVTSITRKKIGYHKVYGETRMWHAPLCVVKPIPLTEETMNNNGWHYVKADNVYDNENVPFTISIFNADRPGDKLYVHIQEFPVISVLYIHEMQHALRLCGFIELADNFKIKQQWTREKL